MTTPSSEAARAEAERRYPETQPYYANRRLVSPDVGAVRDAFEEGAEWKGAQVEERHKLAVEALEALAAWGCQSDSGFALQELEKIRREARTLQEEGRDSG